MRKIAIVADAMSSRHLAPFNDPEWEIWGGGNGYIHLQRADRYFEVHTWADIQRDDDVPRLFDVGRTLGVQTFYAPADVLEHVPDGGTMRLEAFPFERILGWAPRRYFTSAVAWMIAFALERGVTDLGLWGVDMDAGREYAYQRACAEYWLGIAEKGGVRVTLPPASPLLRSPFLYALESEGNAAALTAFDSRRETLERELKQWRETAQTADLACGQFRARMAELEDVPAGAGEYLAKRRAVLERELARAEKDFATARDATGQFEARIAEADFYRQNHAIPVGAR